MEYAGGRPRSCGFLDPKHGTPYGRAVWDIMGCAGASYRSTKPHGLLALLARRAGGYDVTGLVN